jgi:hypothetical protein
LRVGFIKAPWQYASRVFLFGDYRAVCQLNVLVRTLRPINWSIRDRPTNADVDGPSKLLSGGHVTWRMSGRFLRPGYRS